MPTRRKMKVVTDDDDVLRVSHSERNGTLTLQGETDEGFFDLTLSPRQTAILMNWITRTDAAVAKSRLSEVA